MRDPAQTGYKEIGDSEPWFKKAQLITLAEFDSEAKKKLYLRKLQ